MRSPLADVVIATVHPSAVLRAPSAVREEAKEEFFADLEAVAAQLSHR